MFIIIIFFIVKTHHLFRLRLERGRIGEEIGVLEKLENLQNLELIDFELKVGFGQGFIKLKSLKKILLIPTYKEEVSKKVFVRIAENMEKSLTSIFNFFKKNLEFSLVIFFLIWVVLTYKTAVDDHRNSHFKKTDLAGRLI